MSALAEELIQHCREAGHRITGPRRIIAEIVADAEDHPDVAELYRRVTAIDPGMSLSTVYRTLKIFAATGLIERHNFASGRAQIEPAPDVHHDHLIDTESGAVVEFRSEEIERLQTDIAQNLGFELTGHRLVLYGRRLSKKTRDDADL